MTMTSGLRKFALTAHVTSSVDLLGSIAAFLALAVAGLTSQDKQMVRAAYLAMALIARFVIVPLAFGSLLTGLIQSLGTPWGLFRHYWVLMKLLLTVFAAIVLLVKMELIGYAARLAAETTLSRADLRAARIQLMVHAAGGLLVLLVAEVLSVYKPLGITRYGWRKQYEQRALSQSIRKQQGATSESGTPTAT
jgi:predicted permease